MRHAEAVAQHARQTAGTGLQLLTGTVTVAPASHVVGVQLGDGSTLTVNYAAGLSLSVGDTVLLLADTRRLFVAFKVA
jgi:hypothetical protein